MRTVADHLLSRLAVAGVKHVFGVPGDYNLPFVDAIEAFPGIEWVGNSNELNAAYAADAYARMAGLGVLLTTYGVGELSALNGVAGGFAESVPILQITGAPETGVLENGVPVHHSLLDGDHGHFARIYGEVTCASAMLSVGSAAADIDRVLTACLLEKRPGYLGLPSDLVSVAVEDTASSTASLVTDLPSDPEVLRLFTDEARQVLGAAERPAVLVDAMVRRRGVGRAVEDLVVAGDLPLAAFAPGKGTVDEALDQYSGVYLGALSDDHVRGVIEDADVVVSVGFVPADLSTGGFTHKLPSAGLIDLQAGAAKVGAAEFKNVPVADALSALRVVVDERIAAGRPFAPVPSRPQPKVSSPTADEPLRQDSFWRRIGEFLTGGDLLMVDQGTPLYGALPLMLPRDVEFHTQPLWASIGSALPALVGAQLAAPQRRGVLVIGDGSCQVTAQEIGAIVRLGLTPIVFLINNDGYTIERAVHHPTAPYNDIARWDWQKVPHAFGAGEDARVVRVVTHGELETVLAACANDQPRLNFVEVVMDAHDLPRLLGALSEFLAQRRH